MAAATPFLAAPEPAYPNNREDIASVVEECLERTAAALHESGAATSAAITAALVTARGSIDIGKPADLLETLARIEGYDEEHLSRAIHDLGEKVAAALYPSPPIIPFGAKLIAPSAFYDSFEQLHKLGRALLSPVIFAEDTDAIGIAAINPVAVTIFAEEIIPTVYRRVGIRPFITIARLDYESWAFLTRKHFEI